ncbi:MAG: type IV toxin-antitoxin system AbiEi family antitoxin [Bacteroidales bacterium]|nr:type IV toxin-antitoxin system AbiEi family antitoxin [Bacteroidales bacterium]
MVNVAEIIDELLSHEEYSFSWNEIIQKSNKTEVALRREISRLVEKGMIINLRKEFYLILPPRYKKLGILPIELYVDKLFKYLHKDYYLALFSAAKFHGASHQQIQKNYIITDLPPVLKVSRKNIIIDFFHISNWPNKNIIKKKSDAGYFNVSSPALTMVDIVHHHRKLGGLNRTFTVLEELIEELTVNDIKDLLSWYPYKSTIQRTGYLMEELLADKYLINVFYKSLNKSSFYQIPLSPQKELSGIINSKWKVDENVELSSDLS